MGSTYTDLGTTKQRLDIFCAIRCVSNQAQLVNDLTTLYKNLVHRSTAAQGLMGAGFPISRLTVDLVEERHTDPASDHKDLNTTTLAPRLI